MKPSTRTAISCGLVPILVVLLFSIGWRHLGVKRLSRYLERQRQY